MDREEALDSVKTNIDNENLLKLFKNAPNIKIDKNVDIDALMNEVNDVVL